jgi:hypothetical protein
MPIDSGFRFVDHAAPAENDRLRQSINASNATGASELEEEAIEQERPSSSLCFHVFWQHLDVPAAFCRLALRLSYELPARLVENTLYKLSFLAAMIKSPVSVALEKK